MEPLSASPPPEQSSLSLPEPRPPSVVVHREMFTEMEARPRLTEDHSSVWDLGCLLDFNLDDQIAISVDYDHNSEVPEPLELPPQETRITERVRKRDPRLTCSNYLAGWVPCACPEMDEKLEEEGLIGNKRARIKRASAGVARCQVRGCEADISELKGYHRRHRICLRCANASSVMIDGEAKRYCQQCGKFHILSDFDEGKRSCRRKLERHNNRRRRKPTNSRAAADHELQPVTRTEDVKFDGQAGKACSYLSSEINENGALLEHQVVHISPCLAPDSQNINSDGVVSYVASGETKANSGKESKDNSNFSNSPSYCDKSGYTSMCPTGRISFKLYDWNPAEFPRRLRHQIFEWLANMPVELEGYIRPGCTILTTFIAMPKVMWINLLDDPPYYVRGLVSPGKMLSRRGAILVHLNDMIFHVIKDETSVMKVEINKQSPRLHYVHPTYFEAGKPMEFVVCGSNLLQPKFRLLLSFSGEYLKYEYFVSYPHNWTGDNISCAFDNQLYKIYVPHTEPNLIGPAFIEVENESGLSNFIPVLVGDQGICSEMKTLQQNLDVSIFSKRFPSTSGGSICSSCEAFALRHTASSDLLLDIAWLLKDPTSDKFHRARTALQIQRFYSLLDFLICIDSTIILEKILQNLMILAENMKSSNLINRLSDFDITLLLKRLWYARDVLYQKSQKVRCSVMPFVYSEMEGYKVAESHSLDNSQGAESRADAKLGVLTNPISNGKSERIPLLKREEVIMNMEKLPRKSGHWHLAGGILSSRRGILVIVSVAVCVGVCAALFHHERVGELAVSIRRCLFNYS